MPKLVSLEATKADLRMDHDADDEDIDRKIDQASAIVLEYLGLDDTAYTDSGGAIPVDADGEPAVPKNVRSAVFLMVRVLYSGDWTTTASGYPPKEVMSLLYPLRVPPLG